MEPIREFLSSPFVNGIAILLAVVSMALAFVFYKWSRRAKEPRWCRRNLHLVESYVARLEGLDILFKGNAISELSIARVAFWNKGADTLNGYDIVEADPIRVQAEAGTKILDASILQSNNEPSNIAVAINEDGSAANITFDYLDRNQGAVLRLVHTGRSAEDCCIRGSAKGAEPLKLIDVRPIPWLPLPTPAAFDSKLTPGARRAAYVLIKVIFGLILLAMGIGYPFLFVELSVLGWVAGAITVWFSISLFRDAWRQLSRLPVGLEMYHDPTL